MALFDRERLRDLLVAMINTPSPTGSEGALAELLVSELRRSGLDSHLQAIDTEQANAVGRLRSARVDGAELLLYAPIDTHLTGDPAFDVPWAGEEVGPTRANRARVNGSEVAGLGAENPKAYAACIVTAADLIARANVDLRGDLVVGLGAGGMPTNSRGGGQRANVGHGSGVAFMLQHGVRADYAVIAKPLWAVSWEEVGLAWFRIRVKGALGYAGLRHLAPYRNPIADAAKVILDLEEWFPHYAAEETTGLVAPQAVVGAIAGGFTYKPTFVPAACDIFVDMRVSPRRDPMYVRRVLLAKLREIERSHPGMALECEMILAIPGSATSEASWIVRSAVRAWEAIEGNPHRPVTGTSGATDVAILRMWGIPTARLGMPLRQLDAGHWAGEDSLPMNVVHLDDCAKLVEALVRIACDTCSRSLEETQA